MSHFTVAVYLDGSKELEEMLAPFDENIEVPQYVRETKQEIIKRLRERLETIKKDCYDKWQDNKEEYESDCTNDAHIIYLKDVFMQRYNATDEELYLDEISDYEEEDIDESGGVLSTYNPNSKWDYWVVGGRWSGLLQTKNGAVNYAKLEDILNDFTTTAVITTDGEWHQKGQVGWWGSISIENENWEKEYKQKFIKNTDKDTIVVIVDCHI